MELFARLLARRSQSEKTIEDIVDGVKDLMDYQISFEKSQKMIVEILEKEKSKIAVLIDNIEEIDLSNKNISHAMKGLLKAISHFKAPSIPCDIKCCIPSEIYPKLLFISSNPDKDFSSMILLHWNSFELLHMAAIRYKLYFKFYGGSRYSTILQYDISRKEGITRFCEEFFPRTIINGRGVEEYTIRYLLRHTQMLPRQVIACLNAIANKSIALKDSNLRFSQEAIVEGIKSISHRLVYGIFSGFKNVYPYAEEICKAILPNIRAVFIP